MKKFTADFETNVSEDDCRVWAYAICQIGNIDNFKYGNCIEDFIKWCANGRENYIVYFHNLKYDGEYIFNYLLKNGYECIKDKKDRHDKSFNVVISGEGNFYCIEIYFEVKNARKVNKVTIYDSLKLLNFSVENIAKSFDLPISKLEIDYKEYREKGHNLTKQEIDYIRNDVEIMARALEIMFNENLNKMTIGACALDNYKKLTKNFRSYYPELEFGLDQDIRKSYKGGFTYLNPLYANKITGEGIVLDVNSLYPSVMRNELLPFGKPIYYEGKYDESKMYPLYIQRLSCIFDIKKDKIPTIQIKNNPSYFVGNEYLTSSNNQIVVLTLTNIDLELFLEQYDVKELNYICGWKFKAKYGLFNDYVDKWSNKKIESKKDGNKALYTICKLCLNSLYGKFSKNPKILSKFPYINEDGSISYSLYPPEIGKGLYIPMGSFITAYARYKTITSSQKIRDYTLKKYNKDYYIYSDTDSIHMLQLPEEELKTFIDIDDYILGYWKLESSFKRGKFIRQKCYIEDSIISIEEYEKLINKAKTDEDRQKIIDNHTFHEKENYYTTLNVTVAGLPKRLGKYITFDNFKVGFTVSVTDQEKDHKLTYKHVNGGVMLVETDFTIK